MRDTNYTIVRRTVPPRGTVDFPATPRARSGIEYFTIEKVGRQMEADLVVEDIRIGNVSQLAELEGEPLAIEFFSPICEPVHLTLPSVRIDSRIELVFPIGVVAQVHIKLKFYWSEPGAGLGV